MSDGRFLQAAPTPASGLSAVEAGFLLISRHPAMTRSRPLRRTKSGLFNLRRVERATMPAAVIEMRAGDIDPQVRAALAEGAAVLLYDAARELPTIEVTRRGDAYAIQADLPHRRWPPRIFSDLTAAIADGLTSRAWSA